MKYVYILIVIFAASCKPAKEAPVVSPSLEKATVVTYENMGVEDFNQALSAQGSVLLDVRTPEEVSEGKIGGAEELNFYDKDFKDRLLEMDKSKDYYVYCKGGGRSAKTCRLMIKNGFKNVHNLDGGYTAWKKNHQ